MRTKVEDTKRAPIYFPLALLVRLHESAKENRRSFNQEVIWHLEQSYSMHQEASKVVAER